MLRSEKENWLKNREIDANLVEKTLSTKPIYTGRLLHVYEDRVLLPNGRETTREWIKHPGAAAVIPYTDKGEIILVRQYRYPLQQVTWEIPAGKLDKEGEDPLMCAKRELGEETGYIAQRYTKLFTMATTAGFSNEYIHIYLAEGLESGVKHPDEDEFVETVVLPLEKALEMIYNNSIIDAKTMAAILQVAKMKRK